MGRCLESVMAGRFVSGCVQNREIMRLITNQEFAFVNGGDAAVTRPPNTNSWGEPLSDSTPWGASVLGCIGGVQVECGRMAEKLLELINN